MFVGLLWSMRSPENVTNAETRDDVKDSDVPELEVDFNDIVIVENKDAVSSVDTDNIQIVSDDLIEEEDSIKKKLILKTRVNVCA